MNTLQNQSRTKHLFSFFYEDLTNKKNEFIISDPDLCHRILTVTRLSINDSFVLFNTENHTHVTIIHVESKKKPSITCTIETFEKNKPLKPSITLLVALNKKQYWSDILYSAGQLGVTTIQPLFTERAKTELLTPERMLHLMLAGCEQAKQFCIPQVLKPCTIEKLTHQQENEFRFFADPDRESILQNHTSLQNNQAISIAIGPEAGFSTQDIEQLKSKEFKPIKLTPTILRTIDAAALAVGIVRSF